MLLAALVPIVLYCWMRWLETGGRRWLAGALAGLAGQGFTTWYYTVILGLALATLTVAVLCLRWRGWRWRRRLVELLVGGVGVAGVLLPFALPYLAVHSEFGYERGLAETSNHYADVFSFVEAGTRSRLYRHLPFSLTGHIPETSAFVGAVVLALAGGAVGRVGGGGARLRWAAGHRQLCGGGARLAPAVGRGLPEPLRLGRAAIQPAAAGWVAPQHDLAGKAGSVGAAADRSDVEGEMRD